MLSIYDPKGTYCRLAGVALSSLFAHTLRRVRVTLLHDSTLTDDNRKRFLRTAERYGQAVDLIDVSGALDRGGFDPDRSAAQYSRGALFRLLIPALMGDPKVIYLDCDVIVAMDIAELWDIDVSDVSLAARLDSQTQPRERRKLLHRIRHWALHYDPEKYFNSGVLVMNLERIRKKYYLPDEVVRFFERYRHCALLPDQDLLNVLFRDDVRILDDRFNWSRDHETTTNVILHLTGKHRPWTTHRCTPRDYLYWNTFAKSEWADQLVEAVLETHRNDLCAHYHSSDCLRHLVNQKIEDVFLKRIVVRNLLYLRILLTELRYRMSGDSRR